MVREVPSYPAAPAPAGPFAVPAVQASALATISTPKEEPEDDHIAAALRQLEPKPSRKPPSRSKNSVRYPVRTTRAG
jgi:hypothetical protein